MSLSKQEVTKIYNEIQEAARAIAAKHGLKYEKSRCQYGESELKFTLNLLITENGSQEDPRLEKEFKMWAKAYGFREDILNKSFKFGSQVIAIKGLKTRNTKFPVIVDVNGESYKVDAAWVKSRLPKELQL